MAGFISGLELRSSNLREMMARCQVDLERLGRDRYGITVEEVARACLFCRHGKACRRWIDAADPAVANEPPSFCPNADRFRRIRRH